MFHCILSFKYFKKYSQLKIHLKALQILIRHKITQCLLAKINLWMFLYELESTWLPGIRNTFIALNHSTFFQLLLCIRYSASSQGMWWWINETQLLTLSTASTAQCEAFHEEGTNWWQNNYQLFVTKFAQVQRGILLWLLRLFPWVP